MMSKDIETFLADQNFQDQAPTRSQLTPYTDEILELKKRGCTEKMILQFLQEKKGVVVTQSTLNWFINSRRKKTTEAAASDAPKAIKQTIVPKAIKPRQSESASTLSTQAVDAESDDPWRAQYPADGEYTYPLAPPFDRGAAAVAVDRHGNRYQWGRRLQSWADPSEIDPLGAA
ncbi:hypothetical protein [Paralysiella testudinis]|uniref:Uncharacterized protein n=1 Tax=Paralysiella testudinis TaxID=2809020 RepID=A0A892ZI50_9NEIS|nr:hypothetical protein [Paralysiella testudinis]QRQ82871.1 hypothetical protein JQU52_05690 [Paralysiella testudinis]